MRIAGHLGYYNVDGMLRTADAGQLAEWVAYWEIEPFGQEWLRMSHMATSIVNEIRGIASGLSGGNQEIEFLESDAFVPGKQAEKEQQQHTAAMAAIDNLEEL